MKQYHYHCVKNSKHDFATDKSPKDYRLATGRFLSCCREPMVLAKITGDDDE